MTLSSRIARLEIKVKKQTRSTTRSPVLAFAEFIKQAWLFVDPAPLIWSWHLDEMADLLEEAARERYAGEASSTVIACPPGSTKSRPVSILWQPWVWSWWPESAWISATWDEPLAYTFSGQSLELCRSSWYQEHWPLSVSGGSSRWTNSRGGRRVAGGVRSRVTGDHGHFLLIDDPIKEQLTRIGSPVQISDAIDTANGFWFGAMGSRAVDHVGCRVIAMQMLHMGDTASEGIRRGYEHMVLPVTAELDHPLRSPRDHRQVEGELLCPRFDQGKIDAITLDIGPSAAAAQLWQRPEPAGGQLLKGTYLIHRYEVLPPEIREDLSTGRAGPGRRWISAWDLSFKSQRQVRGSRKVDSVVGQIWCAWKSRFWLIDEIRGRWGYAESRAQVALLAARHPVVSTHIVEDAANAPALEDDLASGAEIRVGDLVDDERRDLVLSLSGVVLEPHGGGTLARTQAVVGLWASGAVMLPRATWVDGPGGFVEEHLRFSGDGSTIDDRVSSSSLALVHLKSTDVVPPWYAAGERLRGDL